MISQEIKTAFLTSVFINNVESSNKMLIKKIDISLYCELHSTSFYLLKSTHKNLQTLNPSNYTAQLINFSLTLEEV
jgi:hypothetical protein